MSGALASLGAPLVALVSPLLSRLEIDAFERPLWLVALLPLAVAGLALAWRRRPPSVEWAAWGEVRAAGARRCDLLRGLSLGLRGGALLALALVLAGPVGVHRAPPEPGFGLDVVLVMDASGSMRARDARVDGESRTRLDLAREVVARFATERAAEGDRVGLVVFGESAFTLCPLTSDGGLLASALARVEAGMAGEATAVGDALALAVKRALAGRARNPPDDAPAGRVVVLLTDGRNNAGRVPPAVAAEIARAEGVRVHTVGIGTSGEAVPMARAEGTGRRLRLERHDVDRESLALLAATTGGRSFPAQRSEELGAVYREIDALERVERLLPPRTRSAPRPEPLLAAAGGLLLLELVAARIAWRRLP